MSGDSDCAHLYRLINRCTESLPVPLTKEKEKDVLIAFSQVLREIRLWVYKHDSNSEEGKGEKSTSSSSCSSGSNPLSEDRHCLAKVVADLIPLLTAESPYVQHLAGNVLVTISEFLALSGSNWNVLVHSLCVCLELALSNTLSYYKGCLIVRTENLDSISSSYIAVLEPKLKDANWSTVAGIIRVLRRTLKSLNQEYDEELVQVFLDSVKMCLSNVPWDFLDEVLVAQSGDVSKRSHSDALSKRNFGGESLQVVFLGNLVQFLCSLIEKCKFLGAADDASEHPLLLSVINLVPKLLLWCFGKHEECVDACVSRYFQHKLLVLMIRLSYQTCLDYSTSVSWLQLLHKYYWDILLQPLSPAGPGQDDCLEGSPFVLTASSGEVCNVKYHYLQRRAIFLFLRCCFTLISLSELNGKQCTSTTSDSRLFGDPSLNLACCYRENGLLDLYKWLQGHILIDGILDQQLYMEKCMYFSESFLHLYIYEDDLLFKVLLELLNVPFYAKKQETKTSEDFKEEILIHISNIFNPVHLFHLFLAELHYDHQVLLDCLISKDTGVSCAEYLLKSIRAVCNSWDTFAKVSAGKKVLDQSSSKKRKALLDSSDVQTPCSFPSLKNEARSSLENCSTDQNNDLKHQQGEKYQYSRAKECLLSLKVSVESLHQKRLFPYNPEALLKRLARFQYICLDTEKKDRLE